MKITGDSNARSSKRPTLSWILTYLNTLQANYQSPCQTQKKHKKNREILLIVAYKLETQQVGNKNLKKCFTGRKTCEDTKTGHKSGLQKKLTIPNPDGVPVEKANYVKNYCRKNASFNRTVTT
jgi:hypothetical protein